MKNWKFYLIVLSLSSCGYRWDPAYPYATRPTISVPYVKGDEEGLLTAEIIQVLSESGLANVVSSGGDYRLEISITNTHIETVGYRVDPQKVDGKIKKDLLDTEGRKSVSIAAALYSGNELVYGPYQITADADYDYVDGDSLQDLTFLNPSGKVVTVLPFSLGQLEPNESAQLAANAPLNTRLAQKIIDAIFSDQEVFYVGTHENAPY